MADSSSPRCCSSSSPRRCLFCTRLSPYLLVSFLLLFLFLFQLDLVPQFLPPHVRYWQSQVSRYLRHFGTSPSPPLLPRSAWRPPPPPPSALLPPPLLSQTDPAPPVPANASNHTTIESAKPRVAICLVGGARAFELTGPSLRKYVLLHATHHYKADVFLHAPLDRDSYKLNILKDVPNLADFRIFVPQNLPETRVARDVLTSSNSPHGIQGLLQYFNLVEGCINMIKHYQTKHNFVYDWVIRTRLDGFWSDNLPLLEEMDDTVYTVPVGSQFGGLNDRLGIGNWKTSQVALSRLSLLPVLHEHGLRGLNSETSFKQQLKVRHIRYKLKTFPFCVLSHRTYGWPPGRWGVPVLSISSKGSLNGAKCRPCTPMATGKTAQSMIDSQEKSWAWIGSDDKPELCNPTKDWEENWPTIFDNVVGSEFSEIRRAIVNQTTDVCIKEFEELRKQVEIWDGPSSGVICEKGLVS